MSVNDNDSVVVNGLLQSLVDIGNEVGVPPEEQLNGALEIIGAIRKIKQQRDEYLNHLTLIAEMTGNKGDIGAAHEGVNAVIEECGALARFADQVVTTLLDSPGCDIDGKCAEDWLLDEGIIFGEPFEPNGKHSQSTLEDVEEGETILQCSKWFAKAARQAVRVER